MSHLVNPSEFHLVRRLRRFTHGLRRLAARLFLAPLVAELDALRARQDQLEHRLHTLLGQTHDREALARRLAALEDAVIELREVLADAAASARDSAPVP
jgi:hypothetical protein